MTSAVEPGIHEQAVRSAARAAMDRVVADEPAVDSLRPAGRSSAEVALEIRLRLQQRPTVPVVALRVRARHGGVIVRGSTPRQLQIDTVLNLPGSLDGVLDVVDAVTVERTGADVLMRPPRRPLMHERCRESGRDQPAEGDSLDL